jgi:hypothetical protein
MFLNTHAPIIIDLEEAFRQPHRSNMNEFILNESTQRNDSDKKWQHTLNCTNHTRTWRWLKLSQTGIQWDKSLQKIQSSFIQLCQFLESLEQRIIETFQLILWITVEEVTKRDTSRWEKPIIARIMNLRISPACEHLGPKGRISERNIAIYFPRLLGKGRRNKGIN